MSLAVDSNTVTTVGLESSPVAAALAGLRRIDDPNRRAVGFKLSEGMEVPEELASRFKFARQKSKLAGTIRGSYFAFKTEYPAVS